MFFLSYKQLWYQHCHLGSGGRWVSASCSTDGCRTTVTMFISAQWSCMLLQCLLYLQVSQFHSMITYLHVFFRQEALLAAISEKDANIALLELSSSKKKTQDEVAALKREKDRLVQQLKQQVSRARIGKKPVHNLI